MKNRNERTSRRFSIELTGWYKSMGSQLACSTAITLNIGGGGICFVSKKKLSEGTKVELHLNLEELGKVNLHTEVMWSEKLAQEHSYKTGVKIFNSTQGDEERFIRYYCQKVTAIPRRKKKILIIEDEKDMAFFLRIGLEEKDYEVICAHDGEEGFEKYMLEQPDLIILDLGLPKLNGHEVCRKIRREEKDEKTVILMLSAYENDVDRICGKVIGAHSYLTKPTPFEAIVQEIEKLLGVLKLENNG